MYGVAPRKGITQSGKATPVGVEQKEHIGVNRRGCWSDSAEDCVQVFVQNSVVSVGHDHFGDKVRQAKENERGDDHKGHLECFYLRLGQGRGWRTLEVNFPWLKGLAPVCIALCCFLGNFQEDPSVAYSEDEERDEEGQNQGVRQVSCAGRFLRLSEYVLTTAIGVI